MVKKYSWLVKECIRVEEANENTRSDFEAEERELVGA